MDSIKAAIRRRVSQKTWGQMATAWHLATLPSSEIAWRLDRTAAASRARLRPFRNKHLGQRCFILGNGPSLKQMNLGSLKNEYTFGLNRIYLAFDWLGFIPSYYVAVNSLVMEQCAEDINSVPTTRFLSWQNRHRMMTTTNAIYLRSKPYPHFSTEIVNGVWEGATVTYVAMQLAHYMGFSKVIIVGVDHSFATKGEPHKEVTSLGDDPDHFAPEYFGKGFRWHLPDLERSEIAYRMALAQFSKSGREIVDATLHGNLQVFPKVDFDSLF